MSDALRCGMQYDPIQGQGHERLKFGNPLIFKSYLLRHLLNVTRILRAALAKFCVCMYVCVCVCVC